MSFKYSTQQCDKKFSLVLVQRSVVVLLWPYGGQKK